MQRTQSCLFFPCKRYKLLAATVGNMAKFPCTRPHTSSTCRPFDHFARILTPGVINYNCGGFLLFTSFFPYAFVFLQRAPPRALHAHAKNPSIPIFPVTPL